MLLLPEDFYYDPDGRMVLTEKFLLKRGYCCSNGCRHCPYKNQSQTEEQISIEKRNFKKNN